MWLVSKPQGPSCSFLVGARATGMNYFLQLCCDDGAWTQVQFSTEPSSRNLIFFYNVWIYSILPSLLCCWSFSEPVFFEYTLSSLSVACDIASSFCFFFSIALLWPVHMYSQCHLQLPSSLVLSPVFPPTGSHHALCSDMASISTASCRLCRTTGLHFELDADHLCGVQLRMPQAISPHLCLLPVWVLCLSSTLLNLKKFFKITFLLIYFLGICAFKVSWL